SAGLTMRDSVAAGHKVALRAIPAGDPVVKYGHAIGVASRDIAAGEHVHSHNLVSHLRGDLSAAEFRPSGGNGRAVAPKKTAECYRRPAGRVASRNEIWIVNTVGCVNRASETIAAEATTHLIAGGAAGSASGSAN